MNREKKEEEQKEENGVGLTSEGNGVDPVCQISHRRRSSRLMICSLDFTRQLICRNNLTTGKNEKLTGNSQ
jgi:hypothetical protein